MSLTAADLAAYVNTSEGDPFIAPCLEQATAMVDGLIESSPLGSGDEPREVPATIRDRAVLEVGSELFHRHNAPNGIAQFATTDAAPIRVARDPMIAARPILAPYLGGGFG